MNKVELLQKSGLRYDSSVFKLDTVGYYHPPLEFEDFDAKMLSFYMPVFNKYDLPRPADAPRIFHYEWRQRALKELFHFEQIDRAEYHAALIELNGLARTMIDDPEIAAIIAAELLVLQPPPPPPAAPDGAQLRQTT